MKGRPRISTLHNYNMIFLGGHTLLESSLSHFIQPPPSRGTKGKICFALKEKFIPKGPILGENHLMTQNNISERNCESFCRIFCVIGANQEEDHFLW